MQDIPRHSGKDAAKGSLPRAGRSPTDTGTADRLRDGFKPQAPPLDGELSPHEPPVDKPRTAAVQRK